MDASNEADSHLAFLENSTGDATIDADLEYIKRLDWSQTSIGSITAWPRELLVLVNLAMLSPQPQLFLLGPDSIILYNTAYGRLLRDHHPEYQCRPIAKNQALIANAFNIDRIVSRAKTKEKPANENWVPFFFRNGKLLEEVFLSATMVKLPLELGGFHATTYDTTADAVKARRDFAFDQIFGSASSATDLPSLWRLIIDGLETSDDEVPCAALYQAQTELVQDPDTDFTSRYVDTQFFQLEGAVGAFSPLPSPKLDLHASNPWSTALRKASESRTATLIEIEDGSLPENFRQAALNRCYGDKCRQAVVLPSALGRESEVHSLLVLGLAPRRPYNDAYQSWIKTCHRALTNLVASITISESRTLTKENEKRRAIRERDLLAKELRLKEQEALLATDKVQQMLRITESANVGVFECLPNGDLIQANGPFRSLSGCPKDLGSQKSCNIFDYCFDADSAILKSHWQLLLAARPVTLSIRLGSGGAPSQWVQAACVPVLDNDCAVISITGCITDISAQKTVEQEAIKRAEALEQLRLSEARLLKFIETAPLGILFLDKNKHPTFVNSTWLKLTAHPLVPADQIDLHSVIVPEDVITFDEEIDRVSRSGEVVDFQMRLKRVWTGSSNAISEHAWVLLTAFPDFIDGKIHQIMVAMTDITHLKFAESIQRLRLEEALEARRQQENFVDMTSHEIRNPLSAVLHCTDSIWESLSEMKSLIKNARTADRSPAQRTVNTTRLIELHRDISDSVNTIMSCTMHQKRITDDILSLSKLDSNLLEICPTIFKTDSLLRQVNDTFTVEATRADVDLRCEGDESLHQRGALWVKADSGRIMQVLVNLVANAIKFTKGQKADRSVTVSIGAAEIDSIDALSDLVIAKSSDRRPGDPPRLTKDAVYLWFRVHDTGCGMNAAGRSRIFSRFTQASPKTYNKYGGSGLGLFISQKLVALQGGEIGFKSEADHGSTFAFYVSVLRAVPPKQEKDRELSHNTYSPHLSREPLQAVRILLVEDNLLNQKVLKQQLVRHGFIVYTANDGQAAFDFVKSTTHWKGQDDKRNDAKQSIDVILMDIEMPILDGMQCAGMIRTAQNDNLIDRHLPIIAVTANARPEQVNGAIKAGMDDVITKPFSVRDLISVIGKLGLRPVSAKSN